MLGQRKSQGKPEVSSRMRTVMVGGHLGREQEEAGLREKRKQCIWFEMFDLCSRHL